MKDKQLEVRIKNSLVIALFIGLTFSVYGPLEIVLSNPDAFWFQVSDILPTMGMGFLFAFGIVFLLLFALSYFSEVFYALFCGFGVAIYVQGFFAAGNDSFLNTMMWIAVIAGFIILFDAKSAICKKFVIFASVGILSIQLITIGFLFATIDTTREDHFYVSTDNQWELSDGHNIVTIVAEGFDGKTFSEIIAKEPDLLSQFNGFVFYPDTCAAAIDAAESGITLLTGKQFGVDRTFRDNVKEAYFSSPLYEALKKNGYSINVYAPKDLISGDVISQIDNICQDKLRISSIEECGELLYKMVAFEYLPQVLKSNFQYSTEEFSDIAVGSATSPKYLESNVQFYDKLVEDGVSSSDATNSYHLYWIEGNSDVVQMDRNCVPLDMPVQETDAGYTAAQYEQAVGVVNLMSKLIAELKNQELYDNTTIIFTADHGKSIQENPLLMVKPANAVGTFQISEVPISIADDYLPTLMYHITGSKDHGNTIYDIDKNESRERELYKYFVAADGVYQSISVQKVSAGEFLDSHVPEMGMCKVINLADKDSATMLGTGWHQGEGWGRWASESAAVKLKLDNASELKVEVTYRTYAGSENTNVLYNGRVVATLPKSETDTVASITIPKAYHNAQKVQLLTFETENTSSPAEDGTGNDNRLLSIAVSNIKVSQTEYTLGSLIDFTKHGNGTDYFLSGVSGTEATHTWSMGKTAQFRLPLAEEPENDLTAKIFLSMVFNGSQRVIVRAEGKSLFDGIVSPTDATIIFQIPKSCIRNGELALDFEYPGAISPLALKISEDPREIAIGFYAMAFDIVE